MIRTMWPDLMVDLSPLACASLLVLAGVLASPPGWRLWSQAAALVVSSIQVAAFGAILLIGPEASRWAGAPNTSAACALAGSALLLLEWWPFGAALLGSMVFTIGGVGAIGHVVGESAAFSWGEHQAMGLGSAVILMIVSPGIVARAFRGVRPTLERALRWAELLGGATVALAGVLFWLGLRAEATAQRTRTIEATARGMAGEVAARVNFMVEALQRLAQHGAGIGGWQSRADWASDARISLGSFSGFETAEWIDASFLIRALAPAEGDTLPVRGQTEAEEHFRAALRRARVARAPAIAGPFRLTSGDEAFRIVLPMAAVGQPEAFLSGVFSFDASFAALFANFAPDYDVVLRCGAQRVLQRGSPSPDAPLASSPVTLPDPTPSWSVLATPHSETLVRLDNRLPEVALGAGLLVGLLLSVVIRLGGAAYLRASRFERAVRERTRELESANAAKDRFMTVLSHELRNPLGSISNAVAALSDRDAVANRRMRDIITRQSTHLKRLADDLLDSTRIERGKVSLDIRPVSLSAELSEAVEAFGDRIEKRGITLTLVLPPDELWVEADPTRLAQIVGNLLANAAKFTPAGGWIRVSAGSDAERAWITVRDTGQGIEKSELPLLFEPFAQGEEALRRGRGGLGLGLAIVKGLTEACGGAVEARSSGRGKGAEFVVRLPRSRGPRADPTGAAAINPRRPRRILVIDDHEDSAEGLAELLRREGHTVDLATDGPSGLQAARSRRPDLVICDLGLPTLDGFEVARALRRDEDLASLQLLALSGFGDDASVAGARDAGFDGHLTKPIDPDTLRRLASGQEDPRFRTLPPRAS